VCNRLGISGLWDWKRYGREQSWPCLTYCLRFCLEGLRKTTGNVSQNCGNSNWAPPKYKSEALPLESTCSVMWECQCFGYCKMPFSSWKLWLLLSQSEYSYSTTNKMHLLSQIIYFCKMLYMFQTVFPSIIRSSKLLIQQRYMSNSCCYLLLSSRIAAGSSSCLTYTIAVYAVLSSW